MKEQKMIVVDDVSKIYNLYNNPGDRLKEALFSKKSRHKEFKALDHVSFEVNKGEIL